METKYPSTVIEVKCPECKEVYNVRTDVHVKVKNCRCTRGTFEIHLGTGYKQVRIYFTNRIGVKSEFKNFSVIAQEKK